MIVQQCSMNAETCHDQEQHDRDCLEESRMHSQCRSNHLWTCVIEDIFGTSIRKRKKLLV